MMKRLFVALLTLTMLLSMVACGGSKKPAEAPVEQPPVVEKQDAEKPVEAPKPEEKPVETPKAEEKPAEPEVPAEPEKPATTEKTPTSTKMVNKKFTLKNKDDLGAVTSLKLVPTGSSGSGANNLVSAPAKGVVYLEGKIAEADYYDVLIVFEQGGRKLVGIPASFDKISLKDGGASVADEANGVDYVTSKSGVLCQSTKFKFQDYNPPKETTPAKPAETPKPVADPVKPVEVPVTEPVKPVETPAVEPAKTVEVKFSLKNKEDLGAVKSLKIVPTGKDASEAKSLIAADVAKGAEVAVTGTVSGAEFYDIVVEFEQGTKVLAGVPAAFDKVSLKDGGASIANEAANVKYVVSKSGAECNSDTFKFQ